MMPFIINYPKEQPNSNETHKIDIIQKRGLQLQKLYEKRNGNPFFPRNVAHFARREIFSEFLAVWKHPRRDCVYRYVMAWARYPMV